MSRKMMQGRGIVLLILVLVWPGLISAAWGQTDQASLTAHADWLIDQAVKKPYGWGWAVSPTPTTMPGQATPITMNRLGTPAAGLLLWQAGKILKNEKYTEAARQVARGIADCQQPTGKIPAIALFGASAGGHEPPQEVPDRDSTNAATGFLLAIIRQSDEPDERIKAGALRCARWLKTQETLAGGWPSGYPPTAEPAKAERILRWDTDDARNSTFAILLAAQTLDDSISTRCGQLAIHQLLALRISETAQRGAGTWSAAYTGGGVPRLDLAELPYSIDTAASFHALQTLLAFYALTGDAAAPKAILAASQSLTALRRDDGKWFRFYSIDPRKQIPATAPSTQPTREHVGLFEKAPDDPKTVGPQELAAVLELCRALDPASGQDVLKTSLAKDRVVEQMTWTICGLDDGPATSELAKRLLAMRRLIDGLQADQKVR